MMMRPYQIYAVEAIIQCIDENKGNGYIWHTTGSGKTLTSFKASTLLKNNDTIKKVLFVVDRKDLDRQTREEFNKFQENCVEENTNTYTLVDKLLSTDYVIVPITRFLKPEQVKYIIDDAKISIIVTDKTKIDNIRVIDFQGRVITFEPIDDNLVSFKEIYKCFNSKYITKK